MEQFTHCTGNNHFSITNSIYHGICKVGKAMSSNESAAYDIMTELDVDYVLVIFGGVIGYSGDDINKFLWMVSNVKYSCLLCNAHSFQQIKTDIA